MIWFFTISGVIVLFGLQYHLYIKEKEADTINKKTKSGKCFVAYLKSTSCLKTIMDLLVIILGATIAINCTELYEKKQIQDRTVSLLELAKKQIENSYLINEMLFQQYDESKLEIGQLKYNISHETSMTELILENNDVLVTLTPFTIGMQISDINNLKIFTKLLEEADNTDENIELYASSIQSTLYLMKEGLSIEIDYLNGRTSKEQAEEQYGELINSKSVRIPETE